MLTGRAPFQGEDVGETLARVIQSEPRWDDVPVRVRRLLQNCLEKDPRKRLRDIGDVWRLLDEPAAVPTSDAPRAAQLWLWPIVAGVMALVAAAAIWAPRRTTTVAPQPMWFQINPPENTTFDNRIDEPPCGCV